jgi:hypothetical protein
MTAIVTRQRPSVAARRSGYLVAAALNVVVLYLAFVEPGWRAVPFLTEETSQVLGLFAFSLVTGIVWNLLYVGYERRWFKALGDLVTTIIGLAVLVRIWQVFPFDFGGSSTDWAMIVRVVLAVAIAGSVIGVVVQVGSLVRDLIR